ncbi:response regulator [Trujillonella endophytica]|uniref:Hpt domain-containing protein n=1 Tax=Trujillonella endophytica TaxID=673521 RepID=A0A1H8UUB6_9ACTN|nr:response regulator [Trujillella endophytica]SEP06785.1 Hpt domain-containing protein [Trujillella endophytica]
MLTALVVGPDATDRARTAALVSAAGWQVREATGVREALAVARSAELDLVVTDLGMPDGDGPALLRRLRLSGCRAHLVGTATEPTAEVREAGSAAGAFAVLPAPVDAGVLLRFLLGRGTAAADGGPADDTTEDIVDGDLDGRLQELYVSALPGRLSAIDAGARAGDAPALAFASTTLAGTSAQLGHPEVAQLCRAIAADARRGVLAHELVDRLLDLATA